MKFNANIFLVDIIEKRLNIKFSYEYYDPEGGYLNDLSDEEKIIYHESIKTWGHDIKRNNCSTRAISKVLDIDYREALELQCNMFKKYNIMPDCTILSTILFKTLNWQGAVWINGEPPVLAAMLENPSDKYLVFIDNHVVAVVNNVFYDNYKSDLSDPIDQEEDYKAYIDNILTQPCNALFIP